MKVIIATIKSWNIKNAQILINNDKSDNEWKLITNKDEFLIDKVRDFNPDYIFFPHWSWIIPEEIHKNYKCIIFHMTDLPFGRGGSPLQNLLLRGYNNTKISAVAVTASIDAGPIYMKKDLDLQGTADDIYIRASSVIFSQMIPEIISGNIEPIDQKGQVVEFKRRTPIQSELNPSITHLQDVYDFIRMLDGEGYPKAYLKLGKFKFEFNSAVLENGRILASATIQEVESE